MHILVSVGQRGVTDLQRLPGGLYRTRGVSEPLVNVGRSTVRVYKTDLLQVGRNLVPRPTRDLQNGLNKVLANAFGSRSCFDRLKRPLDVACSRYVRQGSHDDDLRGRGCISF